MVNEPQMILDCIPCLLWNLIVPALAWALVIAGLTWTIRDRIRRNGCDTSLEQGIAESRQTSIDSLCVNKPSESCICSTVIVRNKTSKKGEEACTRRK
jgi:hypothetical protein